MSGPRTITILKFTPIRGTAIRGSVDVRINVIGLNVYGCKLFQNAAGERWVKPPERASKRPDGSFTYEPIVAFEHKHFNKAFSDRVVAELDRYLLQDRIRTNRHQEREFYK